MLSPNIIFIYIICQQNDIFKSVQVLGCQYRKSCFLRTASGPISWSAPSSHHSPFFCGSLNLLIQGSPVQFRARSHTGFMDYDEACFMHLTPGVVHNFPRPWLYRISVPYAQKDPRFLFEKRRGQPRELWSLVVVFIYIIIYTVSENPTCQFCIVVALVKLTWESKHSQHGCLNQTTCIVLVIIYLAHKST